MNGRERLLMNGCRGHEGLQCVEELLLHIATEGHMHLPEHDIGRQLGLPGFEHRLHGVAVGAGIPEELQDLDLAGCGRGHGLGQHAKVDALVDGGRLKRVGCQAGDQAAGDQAREGQC